MILEEKAIEQIYTKCLAQGAYFIESNGEAAVIDPLRESQPYLERAKERGVKIKYIFETHFHADFVSGHISLAKETGATIIFGPQAQTSYDIQNAKDGEVFKVGDLTITAIHTPGHTLESTCYLLKDNNGIEKALFSGDTLFIGDVGRPDLAQKIGELTKEDLAGMLYDSLRNKVMPLSDDLVVYPAHGAGSACGKNMRDETFDTLGNQKKTNYALDSSLTKEEFITKVLDGLASPPGYFKYNVSINKTGYEDLSEIMKTGMRALSIDAFKELYSDSDVLVLDVRDKMDFAKKHIKGSLFIGITGGFAPWVGEMIPDIQQKILIVAPEGKEEETVMRLSRVGYDNSLGFLNASIEEWENQGNPVDSYDVENAESMKSIYSETCPIIDFRKPVEFKDGHVSTAKSLPLSEIHDRISELDNNIHYYIHCKSGYRASIAASIMKRNGISVSNIVDNVDRLLEELPSI